MTDHAGYLCMTEIGRRFGRDRTHIAEWLTSLGVPIFADPTDRRRKLAKESDIARAVKPQPMHEHASAQSKP
ncbi:MAG: hypothetical protein QOF01_1321 [Thermomicrobiales bacterium]|jgi:hypothetical protein|nr:hypothetical protein [Thermomicrobiales bacterium]